jgi:hypothetical protein
MHTLILALLLAVFPQYAVLNLSTTEAQPGQSVTAYVTIYGEGEYLVTVQGQTQRVTLDGEHGAVLRFPLVAPRTPGLYPIRATVDGVPLEGRSLRVGVPVRARVWLPMIKAPG